MNKWLSRVRTNPYFLPILVIIAVGLVANAWILSSNNFFINDDFDWLRIADFSSFGQLFHPLPIQTYNDRPIGAMFIKLLYEAFGMNAQLHHVVLMSLHLVNGILVFSFTKILLTKKRVNRARLIAFCAGLWFVAWPEALFLIGWDAGIFDLLGCTLFLLFLVIHLSSIGSPRKWSYGFVMGLMLFLSLRTKEMAVTLPFIAMAGELWVTDGRSWSDIWVATKRLGLPLVVLAIYLVAIGLKFGSHEAGFGRNSPYFVSLNPLTVLYGIPKYLALYFNPSNPGYEVTGRHIELFLVIAICCVLLALDFFLKRTKNNVLPFMLLLAFMSLGPVLPLANNVQRLYLYFPSVFLAAAVAYTIVRAFEITTGKRKHILVAGLSISISILIPLFAINTSSNRVFRSYYLMAAGKNRQVYYQLSALKRPGRGQVIVLRGTALAGEYLPFLDRYNFLEPMQIIWGDKSLSYRLLTADQQCPTCYIVSYVNGIPELTQR